MTDTTTEPVTDPGPPPPRPAGIPQPDGRFFAWVRGVGVARSHGWLGGVCAGIAARLGIDPVIIRGVFVVTALIGFPSLLVYAIAWALLPDAEGRIVLQRVGRGEFDPAIVAVTIMAVIAFIPVIPWGWSTVFGTQPVGSFGDAVTNLFALFFTTLLWVGVGVLVLWLVVRTRRSRVEASPRPASANAASPSPPDAGWDATAVPFGPVSAAASDTSDAPGAAPAPPDATATQDEVAAWREQHAHWREQHDAWRRQQTDADQLARTRARQENEARGRAFALEAERRRADRRRANPRASAGAVFAALGAALVASAATALALFADGMVVALCGGFLAAAFVGGVAMMVSGGLRRRSGFLAFVTAVALTVGLAMVPFTTASQLTWPGSTIEHMDVAPVSYLQPYGATYIRLHTMGTENQTAGTISLRKGYGATYIDVPPGVQITLDAELVNGPVTFNRIDVSTGKLVGGGTIAPNPAVGGGGTYSWTYASGSSTQTGFTQQRIRLDQTTGPVEITINEDTQAQTGATQ